VRDGGLIQLGIESIVVAVDAILLHGCGRDRRDWREVERTGIEREQQSEREQLGVLRDKRIAHGASSALLR
jgi:hypothetical protein